jgi:radical SAM superfamily enzyme YgiQ (UPF0313 family)
MDTVDHETLTAMKSSGCLGMYVGVDSASDRMFDHLGKRLTVEKIIRHVEMFEKVYPPKSIDLSFMWGFPQERMEDLIDTFHLISYYAFKGFSIHLLYLLFIPGTPIYEKYASQLTPMFRQTDKRLIYAISHAEKVFIEDSQLLDIIANHPLLFSNFCYISTPSLDLKGELVYRFKQLFSAEV